MTPRERFAPSIGVDTRVSPETAMIDRFELKVDGWRGDGTRSSLAAGFGNMSALTVETALGASVNLFQDADISSERSRYYLTMRKSGRGPNRRVLKPLVSGQIIAQFLRSTSISADAPARCTIRLEGSWNLTRFLQAHEFEHRTNVFRPRTIGAFPLAIEPQRDWLRTELPLVDDDNVIIGKKARYGFALCRPIEEHLADYVGGTLAVLAQALVDNEILAAPTSWPEIQNITEGTTVTDPSEYRLGDIEFYWEFDHATPVSFVDTLAHYLPRVAKRMRVTRKNLDRIETEVSRQSQSATIYLTRKRQVRVYAKTNRRVRFEVIFPDGYRSTSNTTSTFSTLRDFVVAVSNLKAEAAQTLNDCFSGLWAWVDPYALDPTPDQLRAAVVAAADDPFIATTIIFNLAKHGRIALEAGDPLRETVRRLARSARPVLRTLGTNRNIYIVERRYEYARRNLRLV